MGTVLLVELISKGVGGNKLEKWFPLQGERAHSLKLFCMYIRGLGYQKQNRMEEKTEPQT